MKVYLTAIIKSKPQHNCEVQTLLQSMVRQSRAETGCLQYDLHRDKTNENTFVFYEIWENEAILVHHNEQPYIKAFVDIIPDKLQEPPVIIKMDLM
ncbi:putative quinol monooxygenase [Flavobacterium sp. RHBU_3]|uniref:putative quinol monooxygenase n=1 Tax=Flavobacterium sp. RHBU_3 TaxID=3391184 RepID=UPI003984CFC9